MSTALRLPAPAASDQYFLDTVERQLARVLREVFLHEPRVTEPDHAFRLVDSFVETMTGYVLGSFARALTSAMRTWCGDDGLATMRAALHRWPGELPPEPPVPCDRRRPLVGEALARLHVRFAHCSREARCLVAAIPAKPRTAAMFDALAHDATLGERIATELALGWRVLVAAITRTPYPALSTLWQRWVWHLDGRPAPTRDGVTEAGYITLVR